MIETLNYPKRPGLIRLLTNSSEVQDTRGGQRSQTEDPNVQRARDYVRQVLQGDGTRPHCPFAPLLEQKNAYHLIQTESAPADIDMEEQVQRLKSDFTYLSPGPTEAKKPFDPTSLLLSFGHPEAMEEDFLERLKGIHAQAKQSFLTQGRMFAYMHPAHELGSQRRTFEGDDRTIFNSAIPMLVVRRMHRSDLPLLRKPEEVDTYRKFYAS